MPPKKDTAAASGEDANAIVGFTAKETKLLAAAFVASVGTGKIDYEIMETLTKNTVGTLKKFWPPVKRKAAELYPSFGVFSGLTPAGTDGAGDAGATATIAAAKPTAEKANGSKKRKATTAAPMEDKENEGDDQEEEVEEQEKPKAKRGAKKAKTAGVGGKKDKKVEVKKEEEDEEMADE